MGPFGALRDLAKTHAMIVRDVVRTQNRIRALFRSRIWPDCFAAIDSEAKRARDDVRALEELFGAT